jgi:cyclophilin family peptidyl-prolyl cis-trans isomerase
MNPLRFLLPLLLATSALCSARTAAANVVVAMLTPFGPIELELFDAVAPLTVANFLGYADAGAYDQSFIHRSVPGFVIQGGAFKVVAGQLDVVATSPPTVPNEPGRSNVRGTVAMAKVDGMPDSATTQWFINLGNNVALDADNGGFTVFGDVISGLSAADTINALIRVNIGGPFTELPVINWTPPETVTLANVVLLSDVARTTSPLCGDLNGDGLIGAPDVARIRGVIANPTGNALSPAEASRCSVAGTATDCNLLDSTIIRRRLAGRLPQRAKICPAAL